MRAPFRAQRGFSYIGLLIMIGLIGAFAAASVSVGAAMQRRSAEDELLFIGSQFQNAFKTYYEATPNGSLPYPKDLSDLVRDPRSASPRRHLRKIFVDPLTAKAEWGTVAAPGGGVAGVYSLSQQAPIRVAGFDSEFSALAGRTKYSEWVFAYVPRLPVQQTRPGSTQPPKLQ